MTRRGFYFRALMAVILLGLLAIGGYAIYQAGVSQGYSAAIIAEGLEGVEGIVPRSGFGFFPYRFGYGFGFSPIFWGIGLVFRILFFFLFFGFIFRFLFFRRAWGWYRRHRSHKDREAHWERYHDSSPPWMDREGYSPEHEPVDDESLPVV